MPTLQGEGRSGGASLASKSGFPVLRENWTFLVKADYAQQPRVEILATPGLPFPEVTTSSTGLTICKSVNATRRSENSLYWDITAEFSSEVQENQTPSGTPLDQPPTEWRIVRETKFERLQEVVTKDLSDDPTANSAGQPFEVGLTISRFIPVWEFYQFEPGTVDDETIIERNETINDDVFLGRAAETLLLTVLRSEVATFFGGSYRLTQYSLKYNDRKWTHKRLDTGTVYLDGGVLKPYTDNDGNIILGSLNGSGGKVTPGDPPAVLEFDIYPQIDFSAFLRT